MAEYPLARGTTWAPLFTLTQKGQLLNLSTHRLLCTVRAVLVDGTADTSAPPLWQGDTAATGLVILAQSGDTLGQVQGVMPASITQGLPNPISSRVRLYYDLIDNDGSGNEWQPEFGYITIKWRSTLSQA